MVFHLIFHLNYPHNKIYEETCPACCTKAASLAPASALGQETIVLCDKDSSIREFTQQGYPVIAVSHADNHSENLMGTPWLILSPEALTDDFLKEVCYRHHGFPLPVTETVRCRLRELSMKDLPALLTLQKENALNPDGCFFPSSCENPQVFLQAYLHHQYPFYGYGLYAVLHKTAGEFMGICGFIAVSPVAGDGCRFPLAENARDYPPTKNYCGLPTTEDNYEHLKAEVSYGLLQKWQHQGFAEEALDGLLAYGREKSGYEQFVAHIHPSNAASIALAKKCGIHVSL
ncbi:MAG: GNAT family N-acetyltransferase [Clostridiales bacterium]|nr:GNAT family N-acetyltransferase [Clostridiales bacterium]